jgi:hypothetical protein
MRETPSENSLTVITLLFLAYALKCWMHQVVWTFSVDGQAKDHAPIAIEAFQTASSETNAWLAITLDVSLLQSPDA